MSIDFQPGPGQVALVEYAERSDECLTGLVLAEDSGHMAIDLGASGPLRAERDEVVVSVFAPDALYRLRATARSGQPEGVIVLTPVHKVERIQRRGAARAAIRLGVTIAAIDSPAVESIVGRTVDVGLGGLRVETLRPVPHGDLAATLTLPGGTSVVARVHVLAVSTDADGYDYRLVFGELDRPETEAIAAVVEAQQVR